MADANGKTEQPVPRSEPEPIDVDSAGVYFVPVDVFEGRPGREAPDEATTPPSEDAE